MKKPVTEGSAAQDTVKMHATATKSQMLGAALAKLAGLDIEDLSHYLNDTLAQVSDKNSSLNGGGAPDASGKNKASLNMHPSDAVKEATSADLAAIFGDGEELSEEIKTQTAALFEQALEARMIVEREALVEETQERLTEAYEEMQEEMADKVVTYLDSVVEQWLVDNEVAIESALRNEVMDDFITGLKTLFAEHYMNVPEDKVEVVEALAETNSELEAKLDQALTKIATLEETVLESQKNDVVNSVCEGLALTTAEKLRSLCESVEFDGDVNGFTNKVKLVKENLLNKDTKAAPATGILTEESDPDAAAKGNAPNAVIAPEVRHYVDAISRSVRK
jgi:hypothetical protein